MNDQVSNAQAKYSALQIELDRVYRDLSDPDRVAKHTKILRSVQEAGRRLRELEKAYWVLERVNREATEFLSMAHTMDEIRNQSHVPRKRVNR